MALAVVVCTALAACSGSDGAAPTSPASTTAAPTTEAPTTTVALAAATYTVQPGVEQLTVTGAEPGDALQAYRADEQVAEGTVDENGALLFRSLEPGDGYTVRNATATSDAVAVLDATTPPDPALYAEQQTLLPAGGFGYVTTRDGTTLSANVILPGPPDGGPYPTVVEYSGYQPSDPDSAQLAALYTAQGFAYVGVNMRGTGCSGGSYRFFETAQSVDGYDVIEAVAAQPWVKDHEVGMVGISYPGISQLFVAATEPPSLNSITPLSVLDDSYRSTLYPGGILNTGFAVDWTSQRVEQAKPYGQEWTKKRSDAGDTRCADNQLLRLQNPDLLGEIRDNPFYSNPLGDSLAPITFVDKITVPVFLAGAWQDEQTGGHFPAMLDHFTGTPHLYVTLTNGLHTESLSPPVAQRYMEFLQLYVGKKVPDLSAGPLIASSLGGAIWGVTTFAPFDSRFDGMTYEQALSTFESDKPVRVFFEQGGNPDFSPGTPEPHFVREFDQWPIPEAITTLWGLGDGGALVPDEQGTGSSSDEYTAKPDALPPTFYTGDGNGIWRADVQYDWQPLPSGTGLGYVTAPLQQDTTVIGAGSVDLWLTSSAKDTDLEVTISEVRPDGKEIYVQSGWLRASQRALDESTSTDLVPTYTNAEADAADLPAGEPTLVRVALFPFAHPFRAGSRLRLTIDAPGNSRGIWKFETISNGETVTILHDKDHPSRLLLPVVRVDVPADAPPACGSLRGQPCRDYAAAANGG
ncbi:MAG: CocE/NonD family hydrolase [Ilumatobacteraceae bacterium]